MQSDQTVISLRPGGGGNRRSRLFAPRFDSPAFAAAATGGGSSSLSSFSPSDLAFLGPHGAGATGQTGDSRFEARERICYSRDQLLQLREAVQALEDILKIKQEIVAELHGEDQSWVRGDANTIRIGMADQGNHPQLERSDLGIQFVIMSHMDPTEDNQNN